MPQSRIRFREGRMADASTFVLIAGGGPVGLSLAIELGSRGVPAILVSENIAFATHPRCNSTSARSMEHFRRLGFAGEIRRSGLPPDFPQEVAWVTRVCGHEYARAPMPGRPGGQKSLDGVSPGFAQAAEPPAPISQLFLEPILRARAEAQASVDIRFGWRLVGLATSVDGVTADIESVTTGERRTIVSRYLVGADGARSFVRRAIGATLSGEDGTRARDFMTGTLITYFLRAPGLVQASGRRGARLTWIFNHELRAFLFAQDGGTRWIVHYQVPSGVDPGTLDHHAVLGRILGKPVDYEIIEAGPWTGGLALVADRYATDRVFLAGDAAHLFTPLGGLGMNTGIGDAMNLGWKLAAMHAGWGGGALLASYAPERRPMALRNCRIGIHCAERKAAWRIPALAEADGPEAEAERRAFGAFCAVNDMDEYETSGVQLGERYEDSPVICADGTPPPPDPWANYVPVDRPGARPPHFTLPDGRSFFDLFGAGFTLVDFGRDADSRVACERFAAAAKARAVPLTTVLCAPPAEGWYRSRLILVRPDQQMAWHGDAAPADAGAVIDRVRGAG